MPTTSQRVRLFEREIKPVDLLITHGADMYDGDETPLVAAVSKNSLTWQGSYFKEAPARMSLHEAVRLIRIIGRMYLFSVWYAADISFISPRYTNMFNLLLEQGAKIGEFDQLEDPLFTTWQDVTDWLSWCSRSELVSSC